MENNGNYTPVAKPASQDGKAGSSQGSGNTTTLIVAGVVLLIILALLILGAVLLVKASVDTTAKVRDVFIIFMALESLIIGIALIILIVQIAILTNLLQNEIKPILNSTSDTVNTLRGTITFISDNAVQPVIRMNSYVAGARRFIDLIIPKK